MPHNKTFDHDFIILLASRVFLSSNLISSDSFSEILSALLRVLLKVMGIIWIRNFEQQATFLKKPRAVHYVLRTLLLQDYFCVGAA